MKKHNIFQKVLTVGIVSTIGFSTLLATGASAAEVSPTPSNINANITTDITADITASSKASQIISYGKKFMGTPYQFGASTSTTRVFDCSSFTKYIFQKYGITLPRTSVAQSKVGKAVSKANLQVGDLLFFSSGSRANGKNVTHVGVYAGNGKVLHTYGSPGVTLSDLNSGNWKKTYLKARRVL
ncbi:cell wall-associated NlpC family hydrolase [Paenibacillus turicensis]|uniref:Cell wall-associated NlpC family hydrolase n=1 Tax=Paenibacillus turicensis TaxID=160487 RepID=A0ABS4FWQ7_9BACL|nr:C40 family peptidase [Paenibacillus turicensis]MBP1907010.1 cell wall-associated NlpC family hydrolase [Paenibacillus turicensis]